MSAKKPANGVLAEVAAGESTPPASVPLDDEKALDRFLVTHSPEDELRILQEVYAEWNEQRRERIEAGDGDVLLDALLDVCFSQAPMPYWLSSQVADAIRRYTRMKVKTLDEAFRVKKRVQFAKQSKQRQHGDMIFFEVCALHSVGIQIRRELFSAVAELHGIKDWNIARAFYSAELRRRGGKRYSRTGGDPARLGVRLRPVYESLTGKKIKKQVPPAD